MSEITKRAILYTGLVRDEPKFLRFISEYQALPVRERVPFYYSTWIGELDRYPAVKQALKQIGAIVIEQPEVELILPGHALHQMSSLDLGLSVIGPGVFVYKSRPDFASLNTYRSFLQIQPRPPGDSRICYPGQRARFYVHGYFASQPFYVFDIVFAGDSQDLKYLSSWPASAIFRYLRTAPEQMIWGGALISAHPVFDAYFRSNVGLVFNNPELSRRSHSALLASPLYYKALAWSFLLMSSAFDRFEPGPEFAGDVAGATLEQLLWDPLPSVRATGHHAPARVNAWYVTDVLPLVEGDLLAPSELLAAVSQCMEEIAEDPRAWLDSYEMGMLDSRLMGQRAAVAGVQGFKAPQPYPGGFRVNGAQADWRPLGERNSHVAALEAEVNQLRRMIDRSNRHLQG